ncbi:hypothetical protein A2U01_0063917, partial [Trifolium medium]|nr:hypothetical protein [Trifolium medium]
KKEAAALYSPRARPALTRQRRAQPTEEHSINNCYSRLAPTPLRLASEAVAKHVPASANQFEGNILTVSDLL